MRVFRIAAASLLVFAATTVVVACSSPGDGGVAVVGDSGLTNDGAISSEIGTDAATDSYLDADSGPDAPIVGTGVPSILTIGRFDTSDPANIKTAWPGASILARFDGTSVSATMTQTDGFSGGPSFFNVLVDGALDSTISISGTQTIQLKSGLAAGIHLVELQKRTEANLGVVTFSGFTFGGGAGLLAPPARQTKRIEWLSDSTIDGFGVDGDRNISCIGTAPPQYNNARESTAWFTSSHFDAEMTLLAYSGKGITKNESAGDALLYPAAYARTIPDRLETWNFAINVPHVVVLSIGGTDVDNASVVPATFQASYGALLDTIRTNYPAAHVFATVWSQIKDLPPNSRTAMSEALAALVNARRVAGDTKIHIFVFPQSNSPDTDETGCLYHATASHHQAMANLLITKIGAQVPGF